LAEKKPAATVPGGEFARKQRSQPDICPDTATHDQSVQAMQNRRGVAPELERLEVIARTASRRQFEAVCGGNIIVILWKALPAVTNSVPLNRRSSC